MEECRVIQVVKTNLLQRGKGIEGDPIRRVTQYWSMQGDLLWEDDPWKGAPVEDAAGMARFMDRFRVPAGS